MKTNDSQIYNLLGHPKCIRSGFCCYDQEVPGVPGYKNGFKPARTNCIHLIKARKDEKGIWHYAKCKLHNTEQYPEACKNFYFPSGQGNLCAFGLIEWIKVKGVENLNDIVE